MLNGLRVGDSFFISVFSNSLFPRNRDISAMAYTGRRARTPCTPRHLPFDAFMCLDFSE